MKANLFLKVITVATSITVVTSVTLSGYFLQIQTDTLQTNLEQKGSTLTKNLAGVSEFGLVFEDQTLLSTNVQTVFEEADVVYSIVNNQDHSLSVKRFDESVSYIPGEILRNGEIENQFLLQNYLDGKQQIYHFSMPIFSRSPASENTELLLFDEISNTKPIRHQRIGSAHVGISLNSLQADVRSVQRTLAWLTALVILIAVLASIFLSALVTRPIRELVSATETLAQRRFDVVMKVSSNDEIGELASAFNQMTQQLKETTVSKDYVDNVLRTMSDSMIVLSPEGRIETVNRALCQMLGYDESDLIGEPFNSILPLQSQLHEQLREQLHEQLIGQAENESATQGCYLDRTGKSIPILFSHAVMTDNSGSITGFVCMAQDITEMSDAEQQLRLAKEQAEAANQAKSRFLANMSHELRTPLNAILGYGQILHKDTSLTQQQKDAIITIQQSGEHLLSLINEVLDLAKVEAGKLELCPAPFSLISMCTQLQSIFSVRGKQKGLNFVQNIDPSIPDIVLGDEKKLRQVLINLLSNAFKFTTKGEVKLTIEIKKNLTCFTVEDTGCGIHQSDIGTVFEAFGQLKSDRMIEGTGLGLPICKNLVALLGSKLSLTSIPDEGSNFNFEISLPASDEIAPQASDLSVIGYGGDVKSILIADDNVANRDVLAQMLTPIGFTVYQAKDGIDALKLANEYKPDMVLMDLRMPNMNGLSAIKAIRSKNIKCKIIAVTASVFESNRKQSELIGADDFLAKPFKEAKLLQLLQEQLELNWYYANNSSSASPAPQQANLNYEFEVEDIRRLVDFVKSGNVDGIVRIAKSLQNHVDSKSVGDELLNLSEEFKFEEIGRLVNQFQPDAGDI